MTITRNLMGIGLSGLAAQAISGTVGDSLVATGTTQADALLLSNDLCVFSTVASGTGCILPQGGERDTYGVVNGGANTLKIYPPVGGTIAGGATNAAYSLPAAAGISFVFQNYNTILISPGSSADSGGGTVIVAAGKTFTVSNTLTLAGTDGTTMTFPSTSATIARTDAANTFIGNQAITGTLSATAATGQVQITSSTGTNSVTTRFDNTGGTYYAGVEDSAGGFFGATAYAMTRYIPAGRVFNDIIVGTGVVSSTSTLGFKAAVSVAIPAGGTAGSGLMVSSTANFGVFFGSGAPTLSAAKGSLYLRSDGSGIADRAYINTNGSTTWTNLVTAA